MPKRTGAMLETQATPEPSAAKASLMDGVRTTCRPTRPLLRARKKNVSRALPGPLPFKVPGQSPVCCLCAVHADFDFADSASPHHQQLQQPALVIVAMKIPPRSCTTMRRPACSSAALDGLVRCRQPPLLHRTSAPPRTCVAPCYELPVATRSDSRPAPAKLAALLEALQEI
jgi:hypothetical protein